MSRCKACDVILTESELKRIDKYSGQHLDLCSVCHKHSDEAIEGNWIDDTEDLPLIDNRGLH